MGVILRGVALGEKTIMPNAETAALLRAVLDELCAGMSPLDVGTEDTRRFETA
jgi:hypothetical protein